MSEVKVEDVKLEETKPEEPKPEETKPEEQKPEEPKPEVPKKARKEMSLAEAIVDALDIDLENIKLNPRTKNMLKTLPTVDVVHLHNIESFFEKIVQDKEINAQDIPMLFALMQEMFLLYDKLRMKVKSIDVAQTLKAVIQILTLYKLEESEAITKEQKEGLLVALDALLEISINMIDLKDNAKKARSILGSCLWMVPCGAKSQPKPLVRETEIVPTPVEKKEEPVKKEI